MKKNAISLLLVLCLILGLAGCKEEASMNPLVGVWEGETAFMGGFEVPIEEMFEDGLQLELKDKGKGWLMMEGEKVDLKWAYENGELTVEDMSLTMYGSVENGVLTLKNLLGTGIDITFRKDGPGKPPAATVPTAQEPAEPSALQTQWGGMWYGCAYISEVAGDFSDIELGSYDAYMMVNLDAKGQGTLSIRLADTDMDFAAGVCVATEETLAVTDGQIVGLMPINPDNWTFLPMPDYPDQYVIGDKIEDEYGYMVINFFMKQWGRSWENEITKGFGILPPSVEDYEQRIAAGEEPPADITTGEYSPNAIQPVPTEPEPTEPETEPQAPGLRPGEPTSDGDGYCATEEDFLRLYKWLHDMDFDFKMENATYEYVRDYVGVDGEDQGPNEEAFRAFRWYPPNEKRRALYVSFSLQDNGKWVARTMNTQNFSYDEIPESIVVTYDYD